MILAIDGNNLANMCSYVGAKASKKLTNDDGLDVTAVDIFMKRVYHLYDTLYPDKIIICWDKKLSKGIKNFRKEEGTYKANRKTGKNELLFKQCDIIEKLSEYIGIRNIHPNIMEADDSLAWIAHEGRGTEDLIIASFDKDLLQLITHGVECFDLRSKHRINVDNFEKINGVKRTRFLLYKMIMGDRSDNIPGLKGYGKVKSKRLAESETPFENLTQEQLQILIKNKKLMDLRVGYTVYPDEVIVYKQQYDSPLIGDFNKFYAYAMKHNLKSIRDYKLKWEDLCINS